MTLRPIPLGALVAACALNLPWWAGAAWAQVDPTRPTLANPMAPPMGMPQAGAVPAGGAGPAQGAAMALPGLRAPRLAAVHVPRVSSVVVLAGAGSAVIDDRVYRLGDKVPELGTLVAIDGAGVGLRTASGGTRRLALWSRKAPPAAAKAARSASAPNSSATPAEAKE